MHNWEQISSILDRALDLEPDERMAFIEDICETEPVLKANVIHFLASIVPSEELWDKMVESSSVLVNEITRSDTDFDTSQFFSPLKQAGPYRVIDLIARGGMGNVYLAERSDGQFERKVAIKILRHELNSKNHVERFTAERNILSGLEHPNIARLYDGDLTTDNRPYLVMEYVDGLPITTYCKENGCTLKEILNLFTQVCKAVEYAHRNLIVHRDLKPDNILVKHDGTVKILDFGIAKILNDELTPEKLVQTKENLHMLSIQYASPEQITLEKITTATDVYALGLLLYEMITGEPPFDLKGKKLEEAELIICFEEPEKPSSKIHHYTLSKKIKGDLDAIILKALNKKPEERYTSVDQFMDDVHLHLISRPISARPNKKSYRVWKFIRRQPGVIAGVFVGLIVISGYLVTLHLHSEQLKIERDRAEIEARRAGFVTEFLVELFESSDPFRSTDGDLTARSLLDKGIEKVDELITNPDLQAELSFTMARAYSSLGLYDEALSLIDNSLPYYRTGSEQELSLASALTEKGNLSRYTGDYDSAEIHYREALEIRIKLLGIEHPLVALSKNSLGVLYRLKGNHEDAELLYRRALAIQRTNYGEEHIDVARTINNLAVVLRARGDYESAEPLYQHALEIQRRLLGDEHPDVALTMNNLGFLLQAKGDYDAAELLYDKSLSIWRELLGNDHPHVAKALNNLGTLLRAKGDYVGAEPYYREALLLRRKLLGDEHPEVAISLNNLGVLLRTKGDYDGAEVLYRESLAMRRQFLGDEHPDVARSMNNLGALLRLKGNYEESEIFFREALAMRQRILGEEHPAVAISMNSLGHLLLEKGDYERAEAFYKEALSMRRRLLGDEHPHVANTLNNMGSLYLERGDLQEAEKLFHESLDMRLRLLGEEHPDIAYSYENLYLLFLERGEYEKALSKLRDVLNIRIKTFGEEHPDVTTTKKQIEDVVSKIEQKVDDSD